MRSPRRVTRARQPPTWTRRRASTRATRTRTADVRTSLGCASLRASLSALDQHSRVQDAGGVDAALGGGEHAAEQLGCLGGVPRVVVAADGVVVGDRAAVCDQ